MARLITRLADLCRHRAAEERFLRRFCMMRAAADDDGRAGPGWYESSRELECGLLVREGDPGGALHALWLEAQAQRSRAIASPSSITASA